MSELTLPEHLLLLAMEDRKSAEVSSNTLALPFGLIGALLLELSLRSRMNMQEGILKRESHKFCGLVSYDQFTELVGTTDHDLRHFIHEMVLNGAEAIKEKIKVLSEGTQIAKAVVEDGASATIAAFCSSVVRSIIVTHNTPLH